jgi:hypothetical protein
VNPRVRFDDEADAEYRFATPRAGGRVLQLPADLTVRRRAVARFPYHIVIPGDGDTRSDPRHRPRPAEAGILEGPPVAAGGYPVARVSPPTISRRALSAGSGTRGAPRRRAAVNSRNRT